MIIASIVEEEVEMYENGEYIETIGDELFDTEVDNVNGENENKEAPETEPNITPRKSNREAKPKKFHDDLMKDEKKIKVPDKVKRKKSTDSSVTPKKKPKQKEEIYIVEALVAKDNDKYLVKWENYPSSQNTWEPRSAIPKFIVKFYEQDLSRLGMPAPDVS